MVVLPAPLAPTSPIRPRHLDGQVIEGDHAWVVLGDVIDAEKGFHDAILVMLIAAAAATQVPTDDTEVSPLRRHFAVDRRDTASRTYVRERRGDDPPCRPRRLLRRLSSSVTTRACAAGR